MAYNSDFNDTSESDCLVIDESAFSPSDNHSDKNVLNEPWQQDGDKVHSMTNPPAERANGSDKGHMSDGGNLVNKLSQSQPNYLGDSPSCFVYDSLEDSPMLSAPKHDSTTSSNLMPINIIQDVNNTPNNTVNPDSNVTSINNPASSFCDSDYLQSNSGSTSKNNSILMDSVLNLEQDFQPKDSTPAKADVETPSHSLQSSNTSSFQPDERVGPEPRVKSLSEKPPYTYVAMTVMAIYTSHKEGLTAAEIRLYLQSMFPYFQNAKKAWKTNFRTAIDNSDVFYKVKSGAPKAETHYIVDYSKVYPAMFMKTTRGRCAILYEKFLHEELCVPPVVVPKKSVDMGASFIPTYTHQSKLKLDENTPNSTLLKDVITTPALHMASTLSDMEEAFQIPAKRQKIDHEPSKLIREPDARNQGSNAFSEVLHHQMKQTVAIEPISNEMMTSTTPAMISKSVAMETSIASTTFPIPASISPIPTDSNSFFDQPKHPTLSQPGTFTHASNFNHPYYNHDSHQYYHRPHTYDPGYHNYYPNMGSMYNRMPFHQPQNFLPPVDPGHYMNPPMYNTAYYGQSAQTLPYLDPYSSHMMPNIPLNLAKPDNNKKELKKNVGYPDKLTEKRYKRHREK